MPEISNKDWEEFRQRVLDSIDKAGFYHDHLDKFSANGNDLKGLCPFHEDKNPSLHAFTDSGHFKCFGCGEKGSLFDFYALKTGIGYKDSLWEFADKGNVPYPEGVTRKTGQAPQSQQGTPAKKPSQKPPKERQKRPPIKPELVDNWHTILLHDTANMKYLTDQRCLEEETIKRFKIGFDGDRFTIPVKDENGQYQNIRRYKPGSLKAKILNYKYTFGGTEFRYGSPARLYGCDELDREGPIIWCEGEWDRLILEQMGYIAVTGTHGAATINNEWGKYFRGRDVIICYDSDNEGQTAVNKYVMPFLRNMGVKSVKNLILCPAGTKKDKDPTDWVRKGGNPQHLAQLISDATDIQIDVEEQVDDLPKPITLPSFTWVDKSGYEGKRIQCDITICGEVTETYFAPLQAEVVDCPLMNKGQCCRMAKSDEYISVMDKEMIEACGSTDSQVELMLRKRMCEKNKPCKIEVKVRQVVREFFCTQKVDRISQVKKEDGSIVQQVNSTNEELVEKRVYYVDRRGTPIRAGHYKTTGVVRNHPKSQKVTYLIDSMTPQDDDFQSFRLEKEIENLRAIENIGTQEYLDEIAKYVTRIYDREEMTLCTLLTAMSVRWLPFRKETVRGWIISAMIGDSGTGKSQITRRISEYAKVGDFFSGLTGSRTGLAYAMVDHKDRGWEIKVGRYVANSRKILFADEIQKIERSELQAIGQAADDGWMTVDRVRSGGYETQTRLCMTGNPPHGKAMSNYMYGCLVLQDVFPTMMIRRMDMALFPSSFDLKDASIFRRMPDLGECRISAKSLQAQIYWAWNLEPEQIEWEAGAEDLCCDEDERLTDAFGATDAIPLVCGFDMRKTVARISAAWAVLHLSHKNDFQSLYIKKEHVEAVSNYLWSIYQDRNCQLYIFSEFSKMTSQRQYTDADVQNIYDFIQKEKSDSGSNKSALLDILALLLVVDRRSDGRISSEKRLSMRAMADSVGIGREMARNRIGKLRELGLMENTGSNMRVANNFNSFMQLFIDKHMDLFREMYSQSDGFSTDSYELGLENEPPSYPNVDNVD